MAFSSSLIVTSIGTIRPSLMYVLIISPYWEPSRVCSALNRSPADTSGSHQFRPRRYGQERDRFTRQVDKVVLFDESSALSAFACCRFCVPIRDDVCTDEIDVMRQGVKATRERERVS